MTAPLAIQKPHIHKTHGIERQDPYFWLKDKNNPEVINYLNSENKFTDQFFISQKNTVDTIYNEILSRLKETDTSAPTPIGDYQYFSRTFKGKQYPAFYRKSKVTQKVELLIDVNELAKGKPYANISFPSVSNNQKMIAYAADYVGRRFYSIYFKDLETNTTFEHSIENTTGNFAWANDNETIFYTRQDPETLRSYQLYRYNLKTKISKLVYEEKDSTFRVYVSKGTSQKFMFLSLHSTETSETRFILADHPDSEFQVFHPRIKGHIYHVDDGVDEFYILSNLKAPNFKLLKSKPIPTSSSNWIELIPHSKTQYLSNLAIFDKKIVLQYRENGLENFKIISKDFKSIYQIPLKDESYDASIGSNYEYHSNDFRFSYESKIEPNKLIDINLTDFKQTQVYQREVPNYDSSKYKTSRLWAKARDGTKVPVTLLMLKDHQANGTSPGLIYGYGSYGMNSEAYFSAPIFSLIDKGFVYAVAHIRGGAEMGREWYYAGRQLNKLNTFHDFIDVTEFLIKEKIINKDKVFASGGSAGGLLMGAVINMRPDLYLGITAHVPFVDVVTTMLDDTIPLTTLEYDEWGNPNIKEYFEYMLKYSPYDNVAEKKYPHMLVTTGLHDS